MPVEDVVDVNRLLSLLTKRWLFILCVGAVTFGAVMFFTFRSYVFFSSSGRLYLGELSSKTPVGEEVDISVGQSDVGSEVQILSSRSLVGKAILQSGLNVHITNDGEERPRYWKWRISHRDPALFDSALEKVRAVNTDFSERSRDSESFRVRFNTAEAYEVLGENDEPIRSGVLGQEVEVGRLKMTLVGGTSKKPEPEDIFEVTVLPLAEVVDQTLDNLTITTPKGAGGSQPNVVDLSFLHASPLMSAEFLKALMRAYLDERREWKTEDASAAEAFVVTQLDQIRAAMDKVHKQLAEFRANNRVVVLDNEAEAMIAQISKYEEQRVGARLEVAALSDVKRALDQTNVDPEAFMVGEANDSVLAGMAASLSQSRRQLTELETRFNAQAPDVVNQRAQVEAQMRTIKSYVGNRLSRARDNLGALGGVIGKFEEKLKTVPGAEMELAQLTREAEVYNTLYAFLLRRQQQAAITKASTISKNRILDEPEVPFWEETPQIGMRGLSGPLGCLFGIVMVLVANLFSKNYQSTAEVHSSLGGVPVFATLPRGIPNQRRLMRRGNELGADVMSSQVSFGFLEAFRTLRTNLYRAAPASLGEGRVVLVTSPSPGDGKTTCALSLAWILAADGKKVLVVDTDLRKPSHFTIKQLQDADQAMPKYDLCSVLTGECSWHEAARPIYGTQRAIYSLNVERTAPAELLSSTNLRPFLNGVRRDCDYIILDSPAFPLVSDALVMASVADATLSIIRPAHTPKKLALEHVDRIKVAANIHAVVVNDAGSQDIYGGAYPGPKSMPPRLS